MKRLILRRILVDPKEVVIKKIRAGLSEQLREAPFSAVKTGEYFYSTYPISFHCRFRKDGRYTATNVRNQLAEPFSQDRMIYAIVDSLQAPPLYTPYTPSS